MNNKKHEAFLQILLIMYSGNVIPLSVLSSHISAYNSEGTVNNGLRVKDQNIGP